jgi:small subunit ribosomal protein S1
MSANKSSMLDFESLLNEQLSKYRAGFDPGEHVRGVVTALTQEYVTLDVNAKREGLLPLAEVLDEEGAPQVDVGDAVDVIFSGMQNGAFLFAGKLSSRSAVDRTLADSYERQMPVEGKVEKEINGGYEIRLQGQRAFCPFSQISLYRQDDAVYVGGTFMFLISEYEHDERGANIIVSRRMLLEKEREALRQELIEDLYEGMVAPGTVTRIADFGVFVDLGGAEGLIPLRELSWSRDVKAEDVVRPGDKVEVVIKTLDWEANRISLSLRSAQGDPWDATVARHPVGATCIGTITRVERYGAFAEIAPGVEGLIPIGKLGNGRRLVSAREVVSEGQQLELQVDEIDAERRRISLRPVDRRIMDLAPGEIAAGARVEAIVESVQPFGVFMRLSEEKTGLLHISESDVPRGGNPVAKLEHAFPPGQKMAVIVKSVDGDRIALTTPARWESESGGEGLDLTQWNQSGSSESLGSLGGVFDGLNLKY